MKVSLLYTKQTQSKGLWLLSYGPLSDRTRRCRRLPELERFREDPVSRQTSIALCLATGARCPMWNRP